MGKTAAGDENEEVRRYIESLKAKLEKAQREKFTFLLIGRTGVGKSSTINSLLGKKVANVGDWAPETVSVERYEGEVFGVSFTIVDTPGLCDAPQSDGNDEKYLALISKGRVKADCVWFVTRLDDTRVTADEMRGIRLITRSFGKDIWKNSMIVFTFGNSRRPDITYREMFTNRRRLIREEIAKNTSKEVAAEIPAVSVDNMSEITGDGRPWLGELYTTALERISVEGSLPFLVATIERVVTPAPSSASQYSPSSYSPSRPISLDNSQAVRVAERTRAVTGWASVGVGALAGASLGSFAGPVGTAVGAVVGGILGLLGWKRK